MFDKKILYLENISVKSWPALWSLFYEICHLIYYKIELFIIFLKYESVCVSIVLVQWLSLVFHSEKKII